MNKLSFPLLLPSLLPLALLGCNQVYTYEGDLSPPGAPPVAYSENEAPPDENTEDVDDAPVDTGTLEPAPVVPLPVVLLTAGGEIAPGETVSATLAVIADHDGTFTDLDAAPRAYTGPVALGLEGGVTDKQAYTFACRDDLGATAACGLAGLPPGTEWVLEAPLSDKTYMRTALASDLARAVATPAGRWEPRTALVELVIDGVYNGVYVLVERVAPEMGRLDLPDTVDPVTGIADGGFVVAVDQQRGEGLTTALGTPVDYRWPATPDAAATAYITDWFNSFEAVLAGPSFADPASGYPAFLDTDAWVDTFLLNELTGNVNAYRLSAYLWADGAPGVGALRAGPMWNVEYGFGNSHDCAGYETEGWIAEHLASCGLDAQIPLWWARLREDPAFEQRVRGRWSLLREGPLSDAVITERITMMQARAAVAEVRDHVRWPVMGKRVAPNHYVGETWADEVTWLQTWTLDRAAWMDAALAD